MDRRSFLGSILALGAAPAIVKAENLMKLWVPRQVIITPLPVFYGAGDFTVEMWEIDELHQITGVRLLAPDHALLPIDPPMDNELRSEDVPYDTKEKVR